MSEFSSYYLYQEFELRGEQEAIPVYPNVYSIDADGTRERVVKLENDPQCGYEPQAIYRWTNIPITEDYVCDDCPEYQTRWVKTDETTCIKEGPDPQYRWVNIDASVDYYCEGTTKYYKQKKQVSFDGGQTWRDVVPAEYQKGGVAETGSTDCGYVPPVNKLVANYRDGQVLKVLCDGEPVLSTSDTKPNDNVYPPDRMVRAVIGDCITSIGLWAFQNCSSLTSVTIPNSVAEIGWQSFQNCSSLSSITIPNSVTGIGNGAFGGCSSLTSINIPSGVTIIGDSAFGGCSSLTSINIPSGVTSISEGVFENCSSLISIDIPASVTSIGRTAFRNCSTLTSITIPNSVQTIGGLAFESCSSLTSVTIPNSVTSIAWGAFSTCGLRSVDIPNSVTSIGSQTFYWCRSLTSVTIGNSVTSIDDSAFNQCTSLISITVNATTPPTLGSGVFDYTNNCPIYVPCESLSAYKTASGWSSYASRIQGIQPCGGDKKLVANYNDGKVLNVECNDSTTLTSGETKPIGYVASAMTSAEIGDCVTSISESAFGACSSLTSVTIPNSVTTIGGWAFSNCNSLISIDIPNSVTSIGEYAFGSCYNFTSVTIGSGVTSISARAFIFTSLTSITINATTPPSLGSNVFYETILQNIYVPSQSVDAYKSASGWSAYASIIRPIP